MKLFCLLLSGLLTALTLAEDSKPAPGPATDRVGFPYGYQATFPILRTVSRREEMKVVTVYGNALAASVTNRSQLPYPNGSVLVMETASARKDTAGKPLLDDQGGLRRDQVLGLHVMRRGAGFGEAYGEQRSGEWEYVEYRPDGSHLTPPARSAACSACHIKAGREKDFVYQGRLGSLDKK